MEFIHYIKYGDSDWLEVSASEWLRAANAAGIDVSIVNSFSFGQITACRVPVNIEDTPK